MKDADTAVAWVEVTCGRCKDADLLTWQTRNLRKDLGLIVDGENGWQIISRKWMEIQLGTVCHLRKYTLCKELYLDGEDNSGRYGWLGRLETVVCISSPGHRDKISPQEKMAWATGYPVSLSPAAVAVTVRQSTPCHGRGGEVREGTAVEPHRVQAWTWWFFVNF